MCGVGSPLASVGARVAMRHEGHCPVLAPSSTPDRALRHSATRGSSCSWQARLSHKSRSLEKVQRPVGECVKRVADLAVLRGRSHLGPVAVGNPNNEMPSERTCATASGDRDTRKRRAGAGPDARTRRRYVRVGRDVRSLQRGDPEAKRCSGGAMVRLGRSGHSTSWRALTGTRCRHRRGR